ncbi:MAG: orotate phosphoribosyltransferase [Syntrophales bacterium]|nr:orotate phosphoribosyltransferase [Syntrophales bacterium]
MSVELWRDRLAKLIITRSFQYREDPPFVLASGKKSNYYFNCKATTLHPEGMNLIGNILFSMVKDLPITAAGGLTLGADPMAIALSLISFQQNKPIKAFIVRKETKGHGMERTIEGEVYPGERVVILDDVITTGGSTITAIERARANGLVVEGVISLIDREEGGRENILKHVDSVRSVFTRSEIFELFRVLSAAD